MTSLSQTLIHERISHARLSERRAYRQLLIECNYFSTIIPAMHQRFREMYAMTLEHKALHLLSHFTELQPYVLYQHVITSDFITSYPLKFDPERTTARTVPVLASTPATQSLNHTSQNSNRQNHTQTTPRSTDLEFHTSSSRTLQKKTQKNAHRSLNQTYMFLPWKHLNASDTRQYIFKLIPSHKLLNTTFTDYYML